MIHKKDLLEAINELNTTIFHQSQRINALESKVFGNKEKKLPKKSVKQPRSKDGKFAKK